MDPYLAYAKVIQVRIRTMSTESSIQLVYQLSLLFQSYTLTGFFNFNLERNFRLYSIFISFIKSVLTDKNVRKCPKVDGSILDSVLSHTRRSDASEKEKKIACPLLDVFACGQVSSPRLYRLNFVETPF